MIRSNLLPEMTSRYEFDSAAGDAAQALTQENPLDVQATLNALFNVRQLGLLAVLQLVDAVAEKTIPDDMLPSEYMDMLMTESLGLEDGEDVDPMLWATLSANMADALSELGVDQGLIDDLMGDDVEAADAAIEAMADVVLENLPDEGDALDEWTNDFVFGDTEDDGDSDDMPVYDSAKGGKVKLHAGKKTIKHHKGQTLVYKAVKVVRNGVIKTVNKRISGKFIRSQDQKTGNEKMESRSHTTGAIAKRFRSLTKGLKHGVYKGKRAIHAQRALKGTVTAYGKQGFHM